MLCSLVLLLLHIDYLLCISLAFPLINKTNANWPTALELFDPLTIVIIIARSRQRISDGLFLVYGSFVEQVKFHVFCLTLPTLPFSFCDSRPAIGRLYNNISYLDLQRNFTVILYTLWKQIQSVCKVIIIITFTLIWWEPTKNNWFHIRQIEK